MRGRGDEPHGAENKERMNNGNSCTVTEPQNSHPIEYACQSVCYYNLIHVDRPSSPPSRIDVNCFFCCCSLPVALWRTPHEYWQPPHLPQHSRDRQIEASMYNYTHYYYIPTPAHDQVNVQHTARGFGIGRTYM